MKRFFLVCSLVAIAACAQQPPPPPMAASPPPPPPPPPPMTYTVYFDYNSAQLGPAGREVVRFAADAYKARPPSPFRSPDMPIRLVPPGIISASPCDGPMP